MGVAVSDYRLARATGRSAVGIFSGTAIAEVLSRRLQDGDPTGEMREALATFPNQAIADRALRLFFGKAVNDQRASHSGIVNCQCSITTHVRPALQSI